MRAARWRAALLGLTMASASAGAEPTRYTIDPAHTFPMFELSHQGFSIHRGRFNSTRGTVSLDRAAKSGEVAVTIDAASIDTGDEVLEKALRSSSFFAVEEFPEIRFRSTTLRFEDERLVTVDGEFTLLGQTRPLRLTVDHFHCAFSLLRGRTVCGANATGQLLRSEYGMSKFIVFGVGDAVKITLQVEALAD